MSTGFNDKIRAIRMMKGIKQSEIASLLNIKQQSVSKIENGKTRIGKEVADKIAKYFGFEGQPEMEAFFENYISRTNMREKDVV